MLLVARLTFTVPTLSARADSCAGGTAPAGAVEARVTARMQSPTWLRYGAAVFDWWLWPVVRGEATWTAHYYFPLRLDQAGQHVDLTLPAWGYPRICTVATRDSARNWSCESNEALSGP